MNIRHTYNLKGFKHHLRTDHEGLRIIASSNNSLSNLFLIETEGIDDKGRVAYLSTVTASPLNKKLDIYSRQKDTAKVQITPEGGLPWQAEHKDLKFVFYTVNPKKCGSNHVSWFSWMRGLALSAVKELSNHTKSTVEYRADNHVVLVSNTTIDYYFNSWEKVPRGQIY